MTIASILENKMQTEMKREKEEGARRTRKREKLHNFEVSDLS